MLERKLEIQEEANKAALASTPVVKAGPRGFSIQSADGQNQLRFRSVFQVDGRFLTNDDPRNPPDTWQVTRARPIWKARSAASTTSASHRTSARARR